MSTQWKLMDQQLLQPFALDGQSLDKTKDGAYPIIISYSAAQQLLKLPKLLKTASSQEKIDRLKEVRKKIAGKTFQMCYRNDQSSADIDAARAQQIDREKNGKSKDYVLPALLYKLQEKPCKAPVIERDVRTQSEKDYQAKQDEFDKKFGKQKSVSKILTFRIAGISPDLSLNDGIDVSTILTLMLSSTVNNAWTSPSWVYKDSSAVRDLFKENLDNSGFDSQYMFYAEYATADEARNALSNRNCTVAYPGMPLPENTVKCSEKDRAFQLAQFGSASLALDDIENTFHTGQLYVALAIAFVAALIQMGMVGRIIADSRKETAVFRAVGASRLAISQIYFTYVIYIGLITILFAGIIGFALALWANNSWSQDLAIQLAILFNVKDLSMPFNLYGISFHDFILISVVILGSGMVGAILPILTNVRRSPIRDMREE